MPSGFVGVTTHASSRHSAVETPSIPLPGPLAADAAPAIAALVERLVDAIDVRESCEPDVAHWAVEPLIRDLERELARMWDAARRPAGAGSLEPGLRP